MHGGEFDLDLEIFSSYQIIFSYSAFKSLRFAMILKNILVKGNIDYKQLFFRFIVQFWWMFEIGSPFEDTQCFLAVHFSQNSSGP